MTSAKDKSILPKLTVDHAMRRHVGMLAGDRPISEAISHLIKYKANALLITDDGGDAAGVVSKTDLMYAYYAGLPLDMPLQEIMMAPPEFCLKSDGLDRVLERMQEKGIHQVFVRRESDGAVTGMLSYSDFVGILYRFCSNCKSNYRYRGGAEEDDEPVHRYRVEELMNDRILYFHEDDTLYHIMEGLSGCRFWAALIVDAQNHAAGGVSKTDLMLAYKHALPPETKARAVMSSRIHACSAGEYLSEAIRQMIFSDVGRLFVYRDDPRIMIGVLSFTDAARIRSGSCKACRTSRIKLDPTGL